MKKAFLVTANVTTRLVIEVENDKLNGKEYDILVANAKESLINNLTDDYLNCIEDVREDEECPYDKEIDEEISEETIRVHVNWETDGYLLEELGLPSEVDVPKDIEEDDIADYLSDEYGYLVESFEIL